MSQGFRLRFDEMRESDPTGKVSESSAEDRVVDQGQHSYFVQPGSMRYVCFVWPDGKRLALSYSYLVSAQLESGGQVQSIQLVFTSHQITIKGSALLSLYDALTVQRASHIVVTDSRYESLSENEEAPFVAEISVK